MDAGISTSPWEFQKVGYVNYDSTEEINLKVKMKNRRFSTQSATR